ncbi:2-phospho-L-lactate guanylyltransferase [Nocardioides caldifontis]|uniref:2-phospho-L-lactate guanylyltransferase n=1 Tax=Nocardioides caldifontis TaxID=2588938 RepID=UPI0011DF6330|nr:2-phospho-L-lactate guanylyltransferase [Nocardioides caldifontis]
MNPQSAPPVDTSAGHRRFGVVVPVKPLRVAKSRLAPLGDELRRELVAAFAVDTVVAVSESPSVGGVLVVTDEVGLARELQELGVAAVPDGTSGDLNATLQQGAAELVRRRPDLAPVAMCADLPCLRSDELTATLAGCTPGSAAFVPDAAGTGTTLYTAPDLERFRPRFGPGSRGAHETAGALPLAAPPSLRRDVDTAEDLEAARELGVGARTGWVLTRLLPRPS